MGFDTMGSMAMTEQKKKLLKAKIAVALQDELVLQPGFCVTSAGRQSSMVTQTDVQAWADGLDGVVDRIAPRFGRPEPRRRARAYRRGLLAPGGRKNGWQLAEAVGDATPDGVQDFLSRVQWDAEAVRDDLQAYVVQHLGDPDGVAILDG